MSGRGLVGRSYHVCSMQLQPAHRWESGMPSQKCLDWFVMALSGHVIGPLVRESIERISSFQQTSDIEVVEDACEAFMVDVSWQKLISKGRTHALSCFDNPDWAVKVVGDPVNHHMFES